MRSQRGSVALIAIVFLLFLTIIGVAWLPLLNTEAQHAKMDEDEQLAWYAAEAGYKRAYAALSNNAKGFGSEWLTGEGSKTWVTLLEKDSDMPTIETNISQGSNKLSVTYAVGVTNLINNGGNYDYKDSEHMITAVGSCNGVKRIITNKGPSTGKSGDSPEMEIKNDFDVIQRLLNAEGTTASADVKSVSDYFDKKAQAKGKSLDSLGGNYAQYLNNNFFDILAADIEKGTNNSLISILKKVSKTGAPRVAYDKYNDIYYDVTPEHYLWSIVNNGNNGSSLLIYWTYLDDILDDVMSYKININNTPSRTRPPNGSYFVTLDYGYFTYYFLPHIDRSGDTGFLGNPVATLIRAKNSIWIDEVYLFDYNGGILANTSTQGKCSITNNTTDPFLFKLNSNNFKEGGGLSDFNGYPRTQNDLSKLLTASNPDGGAGNVEILQTRYSLPESWNWNGKIKYSKTADSVWKNTTIKAYLMQNSSRFLNFSSENADAVSSKFN